MGKYRTDSDLATSYFGGNRGFTYCKRAVFQQARRESTDRKPGEV